MPLGWETNTKYTVESEKVWGGKSELEMGNTTSVWNTDLYTLFICFHPQASASWGLNVDTSGSYLFPGSEELRQRPKLSRSAMLAQVDFDGGPLPLSPSASSIEKSQQTEPDVITELAVQRGWVDAEMNYYRWS